MNSIDGLLEKEYDNLLEQACEEYRDKEDPIPNFGSTLKYRCFEGLKGLGIDFGDNDLTGVQFVKCDFRGANFEKSVMDKVVLTECHLYGSNLPSNPSLVLRNCVRDSLIYDLKKFGVSTNAERLLAKERRALSGEISAIGTSNQRRKFPLFVGVTYFSVMVIFSVFCWTALHFQQSCFFSMSLEALGFISLDAQVKNACADYSSSPLAPQNSKEFPSTKPTTPEPRSPGVTTKRSGGR